MGKPNSVSWRIAAAIQQRSAETRIISGSLSAYRESLGDCDMWVVFNLGVPVMKIKEKTKEPPAWGISVSMGGWPDSAMARNNINSMLMRFGSMFRVGSHKGTPYLYEVKGDAVVPIMKLDATAWYSMEEV